MIAKKSELVLKRFVVVNSKLSFIVPNNNKTQNSFDLLNSYPVDIDFNIEEDASKKIYRIVVSVKINTELEKDNSGYSIDVTGIGFFEFDQTTDLTEDIKIQMLQFSGLSICITNLRSYIANQTSYFPWGNFSFHAVDLQDLLLAKTKTTEKNASTE
ncbi:MAG: hypothetical protein EOL95_08590 [Bacteroidia bacterium]|nr:hypothetical protein [Bacteroidia bacterium]